MLIDSGDNPIQHTDSSKTSNKIRRNGGRKILYFNPPFSSNVKTKLGKKFLKLVKLYFPKSSTLNQILNKNTIKLCYSCLLNIKSIINAHNQKVLNERNNEPPKLCNCKKNAVCPFNRKCLPKGVYKAPITKGNETKEYIGSTGVSFKTRFNQHIHSFKPNKRVINNN